MDAALRDVRTAGGAERRRWVWRTSDVGLLRHYRPSVARRQSAARLAVFDRLLENFEQRVEPRLAAAREGVVHNDLNDHNTLQAQGRISGVIDLGDVCLERHCFSLGNTLYYMMLTLPVRTHTHTLSLLFLFPALTLLLSRQLEHVLEAARAVVAGYQRRNPLSAEELALAWAGAKLRCLTSAAMSGATQELHPEDPYVSETEKPGWALLDYIHAVPHL